MLKLPESVNLDELAEAVYAMKWFHTFPITERLWTPGVDPTMTKLPALGLPDDLTGKSVLDIGTYNGFFAFESESRGAEVVANDYYIWSDPNSDARKCFDFLHALYGSKSQPWACPVEELDISPLHVNGLHSFDIVLFLGVLYHTTNPYFYLEQAAKMTKELLIIETLIDCSDVPRPCAAFYPRSSINNDPTTHWGLNALAIYEILKDIGFRDIQCFEPWDRNTLVKTQSQYHYPAPDGASGRQVIHAYV